VDPAPGGGPASPWALEVARQDTGDSTTAGALAGVLLNRPEDEILAGREGELAGAVALGSGQAGAGGLEPDGAARPLVVLEMAGLGEPVPGGDARAGTGADVDHPVAEEVIGGMAGVARPDEAAAEVARRLPGARKASW
jgi:hypothetical protein